METFETATSLDPRGDGDFGWTVPDGWQQGRGAWGGLVVGALIRAVEATEPDSARIIRSIAANLVAPAVVGEHRVQVRPVRRGSAVSTWTATVTDAAGTGVATASVLLGAPRSLADDPDFGAWSMLEPPPAPAPDAVPALDLGSHGPKFLQHLSPRLVTGIPGQGGLPEAVGWIDYARPVVPSSASVLALVDAWWPASLAALDGMRPVATISFAANLLVDPTTLAAGEPLLHHSLVSGATEGYTSEHRRLWTADGRLAVDNLQSIVLIA